jgi:hypothetical protein
MNPSEFFMMLGLLVVRFGLPVVAMLMVIWSFRRLDLQWQKTSRPLPVGGCEAGAEGGQAVAALSLGPCWVFKACPDEKRAKCPVFQTQAERCWLAHLQRDGRVTKHCRTCGLFAATTLRNDVAPAH